MGFQRRCLEAFVTSYFTRLHGIAVIYGYKLLMNCDDHRQGTTVAVVGLTEQVNKHKKHHQLAEGQPSSFTP